MSFDERLDRLSYELLCVFAYSFSRVALLLRGRLRDPEYIEVEEGSIVRPDSAIVSEVLDQVSQEVIHGTNRVLTSFALRSWLDLYLPEYVCSLKQWTLDEWLDSDRSHWDEPVALVEDMVGAIDKALARHDRSLARAGQRDEFKAI